MPEDRPSQEPDGRILKFRLKENKDSKVAQERELARKSGEHLVLTYSLGAPFGLFDWVETKYSSESNRDQTIRDGLFSGAARILTNRALGYNDENTNKDPNNEDLALWGNEFDAQYDYLDRLFSARQEIPHKSYRRGILPEPEATHLKEVINSIKFEPEETRAEYLEQKAYEFALAHLGISEEDIEVTEPFNDWLEYEIGHLKEIVYHTNADSLHGTKKIDLVG